MTLSGFSQCKIAQIKNVCILCDHSDDWKRPLPRKSAVFLGPGRSLDTFCSDPSGTTDSLHLLGCGNIMHGMVVFRINPSQGRKSDEKSRGGGEMMGLSNSYVVGGRGKMCRQ